MIHSTDELVAQQVRRAEYAKHTQIVKGQSGLCTVITFSRQMGSGARVIARKVADDLGWAFWGREILDVMARNAAVSRELVEALDEKSISEIEMFARDLLGDHTTPSFYYRAHLAKAIRQIARLGSAVILGRGADILLPGALHVRVEASEKRRVENMVRFENMTPVAALEKIRASDRERQRFLARTYGREALNGRRQDLIINTDRLATLEAAGIVEAALEAMWASARTPADCL